MKIDDLSGNVKAFAEACFDSNSIEELENCPETADEADCKEWSITAHEWRIAIKAALTEKQENDR